MLCYVMLCYLILSYLILSYLILSYLILSYLILSYLILSYLILSLSHGQNIHLLIHRSLVHLHPVEVIVVSSDTSASPVSSTVQNGSIRNDLTKCQRKKSRSRSRSQSESRSVSKGKRIVQGESFLFGGRTCNA